MAYRIMSLGNRILIRYDRRPGVVAELREELYTRTYLEFIERGYRPRLR